MNENPQFDAVGERNDAPRPSLLRMSRRTTDKLSGAAGARRGIYLLPNLFTTAAMCGGFYAIVSAINGHFEVAAIAIFVAMVLDGMDGRIARLTNTQSAFGAEYDSLSDMCSFGLAPALVVYQWALSSFGRMGWVAAFLYATMAALRLARFNTQVGTADKRYFQGLPSPSAAAMVAGVVWVCESYGLRDNRLVDGVAFLITVAVALLMVSNIRYHSFKDLDLRGRVPFVRVLLIALGFVLIATYPPETLFVGFLVYASSGPVLTLITLRQRRATRRQSQVTDAAPPP